MRLAAGTGVPDPVLPTEGGAVLAVVVTYNPDEEATLLPAHLSRLAAQCEVVVVDNGSRNSAWVASCAREAGCRLVANASNVGIAGALNQGARLAMDNGFDWLATFDQDSEPPAGVIEGLLQFCASHPLGARIAVVSVAHRDRVTGRDYHHATDIVVAGAGGRLLRSTITSGSMVRSEVLRTLGTFEERLFIDVVDHELCLRARKAGWLVLENPRFTMQHSIGSATVHNLLGRRVVCTHHSAARLYYRVRNQLEISRRYLSFDPLWAAKGVAQLGNTAIAVVLFERDRSRKLRAMLRGALDFARGRFGPMP